MAHVLAAVIVGLRHGRRKRGLAASHFTVLDTSSQQDIQIGSMAGSEAAMEMPFVVSLNYSKADPATRMLIRSHVMRGKKQKKKRMDVTQQNVTGTVKAPRIRLEQAIEMYSPLTLNRTGPDDSCLEFASGIEQSILLNVMKRP